MKNFEQFVWNLGETPLETEIPLNKTVRKAAFTYPIGKDTEYELKENALRIRFENGKIARFFELKK